ncbi:MAG: response regulator [Treponema sp.]|jgi:DNA-binding response OmpR family regulator|nr:response regulator [Treponema sp.]
MSEKKKILFVDDDAIQHAIAENMLKDDYEVFKAKSGSEALQYLYSNEFIPNLILLDIMMPDMDGWEVFNRIRGISLLKKVPIAFITALTESSDEKRAFEIGADDYIRKPYEKEDLLNRIKIVLDKASE